MSGASEWVIMSSCRRLPQTDPRFELAYVNKMDEYKSYLKGGEREANLCERFRSKFLL